MDVVLPLPLLIALTLADDVLVDDVDDGCGAPTLALALVVNVSEVALDRADTVALALLTGLLDDIDDVRVLVLAVDDEAEATLAAVD